MDMRSFVRNAYDGPDEVATYPDSIALASKTVAVSRNSLKLIYRAIDSALIRPAQIGL
jgi:hypothetical protein